MTLINVLRVRVKQSGVIRYERAVRRFADKARESDDAYPWTARASNGDGPGYSFLARAESYAELGARPGVPELARICLSD